MENSTLDIDRIVREIVSRLRVEMKVQPLSSLTLEARVITMLELEGKLEGVRQLILKPQAIITPSARDELKEKKIEVLRDPAE